MTKYIWIAGLLILGGIPVMAEKTQSVFKTAETRETVRRNIESHPWARDIADEIVRMAAPYAAMSDETLWGVMFAPTIDRSWMVWSDSYCPDCNAKNPMYAWKTAFFAAPWKVRCPHCGGLFPKNDFGAFYRSGLDEHGEFDPALADRSLLFNAEHPDPADPLHRYGIDDGTGYHDGGNTWYFIGTYLVYAQWYEGVMHGIETLSNAYLVTGEPEYARKAAILLDRVADVYARFDASTQLYAYEKKDQPGFVTVWHNACEDARRLALAYDLIFDAIKEDSELVAFLSRQAETYRLANPKKSFSDIRRNIEDGILRATAAKPEKIRSNQPRTDVTLAVIDTVLNYPANRERLMTGLDAIIRDNTAVDGLSGEDGMTVYAAVSLQSMGELIACFSQLDANLLPELLLRHPGLRQSYRFHLDMRCLNRFYPQTGDSGNFTKPYPNYPALVFAPEGRPVRSNYNALLPPSNYSLVWNLYRETGDPVYLQLLHEANGGKTDGLPYDLSSGDVAEVQRTVAAAVAQLGPEIRAGSVDKADWGIGILRSGSGSRARALWLNHHTGGRHSHADGMNLGLFGLESELMAEIGYPAVQFGGWFSPQARWCIGSASHNTVMVDGKRNADAEHTFKVAAPSLWLTGGPVQAIRADGKDFYPGTERYERLAVLVDIGAEDFYVWDVFRVKGGERQTKLFHTGLAALAPEGIVFEAAEDVPELEESIMTNWRRGTPETAPWQAEFTLTDHYRSRSAESPARVRYTELSDDVTGWLADGWVSLPEGGEFTFPRLVLEHRGDEATFVALIHPYDTAPAVRSVRRIPLGDDPDQVACKVELADGRYDVLVSLAAPPETPVTIPGTGATVTTDFAVLRFRADGKILEKYENKK